MTGTQNTLTPKRVSWKHNKVYIIHSPIIFDLVHMPMCFENYFYTDSQVFLMASMSVYSLHD